MKKIYIPLLVAGMIGFSACEDWFSQIVEIDLPPHESRLVSYCILNVDKQEITVEMSRSLSVTDNEDPTIDVADVSLKRNGTILAADFRMDSVWLGIDYSSPTDKDSIFRAILKADLPGEIVRNDVFEVLIRAEALDEVRALARVPEKVEIDTLLFEVEGFVDVDGNSSDEIEFRFADPAGVENFYVFAAWAEFKEAGNSYIEPMYLNSLDPRITDAWGLPFFSDQAYFGNQLLFTDQEGFDGIYNRIKMGTYLRPSGTGAQTKLTVSLFSISEDLYYFLKAFQQYNDSGNSFFSEPVVIPSNFDSGYGIFGIHTVSTVTIVI